MSKTVLLIDYEPRSITRIRRILEKSGYRMETAQDGVEGVLAFERLGPDLTLVQDLLPKKHGFEVCRGIKESTKGGNRPVVLITSMRNGRARELRVTGCDGHIGKPFTDETLLNTVRKLAPNGAASNEARPKRSAPKLKVVPSTRPAPAPTPIPVEFNEVDIMSTLDAIMPGDPQQDPLADSIPPAVPEPDPEANKSETAGGKKTHKTASGSRRSGKGKKNRKRGKCSRRRKTAPSVSVAE